LIDVIHDSSADPDENARRKRCLRAAEELFKRVGFRAVTMELVAREANVAKATLYSYFKNKDELFIAVSARMARILLSAVQQALANRRIAAGAVDGSGAGQASPGVYVSAWVSSRGGTLFLHACAGRRYFADLDNDILRLLNHAILTDSRLAPSAKQLARALYFGSSDLVRRCETMTDAEQELRAFTSVHLAGAVALAL